MTVQLLADSIEDVRAYYQQKFRYVMIDEYQDTNHLQYLLASLLRGRRREYLRRRRRRPEHLPLPRRDDREHPASFEKQFTGTRVIRLEQNYRSTQAILNAANAVIANNQGRKGKKLWTENGRRRPGHASMRPPTRADEANFVADRAS